MALWFAVKEMLMKRRNSGFIGMLQVIMILWAVKLEAARLRWCVEEWWCGDHCQRSGQPNHSILCGLHRHRATHRRCCQEPGGTQSREHSFLIANTEANMFACDSEHYGIVWLCLRGLFLALPCLLSNLPKIGSDVCAFRGSASPWAILRSSTPSVWLAASLRTLSCRLISSCGLSSVLLVKVTSRWSSSTPRGRQGDQRSPDMNVDSCRYEYLVISQYLNLIFCPICFQAWSFTYCIPQVHKCHISTHACDIRQAQLHATSSQFIISIFPSVQEKKFHPEEISSMILLKMKETAEAYLGSKINDAVARTSEVERQRPQFIVKPLPLHM